MIVQSDMARFKSAALPNGVAEQRDGDRPRCPTLALDVTDPTVTLWGNEPIFRERELVGYTSSGCFSPTLGKPLALGYIKRSDSGPVDKTYLATGAYTFLQDGIHWPASLSLRSPVDPKRERILTGPPYRDSNGLWINLKFCRVTVEHDWWMSQGFVRDGFSVSLRLSAKLILHRPRQLTHFTRFNGFSSIRALECGEAEFQRL